MLRHLAVDVAFIMNIEPVDLSTPRFDEMTWGRLARELGEAGAPVLLEQAACSHLLEMRTNYEPFVNGIAQRLMLNMPGWFGEDEALPSWQTTAWDKEKHF
jgi:hypothetical protein